MGTSSEVRRAAFCALLLLIISVVQGAGSGQSLPPSMVMRSTSSGGDLVREGEAQGRACLPRLLELRGMRGGGSDEEEVGEEENDITRRLEEQSLEPSMFDDTPDEGQQIVSGPFAPGLGYWLFH
ncbi:hypothetical protein T484DRAFT_1827654 [Baffinella frigidus]|nr:hypothetical protein T484DRAFT_1827654 [Cryptophyta sp. CCMP2293]